MNYKSKSVAIFMVNYDSYYAKQTHKKQNNHKAFDYHFDYYSLFDIFFKSK